MKQIEQAKRDSGWSWQRLCGIADLPYATFRRWRVRVRQGQPGVTKAGPRPIEPLPLERLRNLLQVLEHHAHRSEGVGALYEQVRAQISRREFQDLVDQARRQACYERHTALRHVQWAVPGLAWAADETAWIDRLHLLPVSDLASRYRYRPLVSERIDGKAIAAHVEALISKHGAPLIFKRDNGSPLCHRLVDAVLARYLVIPLNSPPHYPPYNGAIERAAGELKRWLDAHPTTDRDRRLQVELAAHELNHQRRECLRGHIACEVLASGRTAVQQWTRRKRKEAYDAIMQLATAMWQANEERSQRAADAAWRTTVETWLLTKGVITITHNPKVLPRFFEKIAHN